MAHNKKSCKVCNSKDVAQINRAIHNGNSILSIANTYGLSRATVTKHRDVCLMPTISENTEIIKKITSEERIRAYEDRFTKTQMMIDALDEWMRDPENPTKYSIDDRANEIDVIYQEYDIEKMRLLPGKQKATLQDLLVRVEAGHFEIRELTSRRTDPRKLLLESLKEEREMLKIIVDLVQRVKEYEYKNRAMSEAETGGGTISFEKQVKEITERVTIAFEKSNTEELSELAGLPSLDE